MKSRDEVRFWRCPSSPLVGGVWIEIIEAIASSRLMGRSPLVGGVWIEMNGSAMKPWEGSVTPRRRGVD